MKGWTLECNRGTASRRTPGQIATNGALRHARAAFVLSMVLALLGPTRALAAEDDSPLPRPAACEIDLEVIAILYVPENPTSSMAIVGDKGSSLVRIGSWVGDRRVVQMAARSLVLGPLEDPCVMRLTDRSPQRRVSPRRRVRKRRRR